jgi:alkylation response protein AidB-like acyl-CoA dehydrogenase
MQAMFTMMNQERISVGMQGLGLGEAAYQGAVEYAKERIQGRALTGAKATDKKADPIIVHPDIRRSLLTMRAHAEGCRLLGGWVAERLDESQHHPDPEKRQKADDFVALMTPIVKALFTDLGYDNTNIGMQVYGGHGYIREWGMEQLVRDCRIAQIYEGTNGIQALDLVGRKMPAHMGRFLRQFFHPVQDYIEKGLENSEQQLYVGALAKAFGRLQQVTAHVAGEAMKNPDEAGAAATEYLRMFGLVAMGYMFCRAIDVVRDKIEDDDTGFYEAKMITARFFLERILPQTGALMAQIMSGSGTMMSMPEDLF